MVVAQWKHPFLKYHMTLSTPAQLPNHTQLTGKCITKMLLEVSHYLGFDFSFRTAKCAHARWCAPLEPWAAVNISPKERMGSGKLDLNRPWHSNLTQHSQGQHGDMQASRHHPGDSDTLAKTVAQRFTFLILASEVRQLPTTTSLHSCTVFSFFTNTNSITGTTKLCVGKHK